RAETSTSIDLLVAHEAAHFWNAEQYPHAGDAAAAWLHEGTADAMALRALHALGALDDAAYRDRLSLAASQCALWLTTGDGLDAAVRPGHARAFYECGSTFDLVAEAACTRKDPEADLFRFWRAVFAEAK